MPGSDAAGPLPVAPADAATLILVRNAASGPAVLMGQRGAGAAFMPSKFVFPGGRVDPGDFAAKFSAPLHPRVAALLETDAAPGPTPSITPGLAPALAAAAIRELAEETGLQLARAATTGADAPLLPYAAPLTFVFRAVTPPGPSRRFDARFLLADAQALLGDPDDLAAASGELSHLGWVPLADTRRLALPFITEIVLAEVAHLVASGAPDPGSGPATVPFFDNRGPRPRFARLG
jgi:8-oxo-dGTP pyrophosphatase MutT (NUDIX family)